MRVIAGRLKGRIFASPGGHKTHPMSEKVRGALFNALGDIKGLTILDAFTGSGAVSIEAISRGAKHATAIDIDNMASETVQNNIALLDLSEHVNFYRTASQSWSNSHAAKLFDIVVADPPYDDLHYQTLEKIYRHVNIAGIYVLSLPVSARLILPARFELIRQKKYGAVMLCFYRRIS